MCYFFFFNASLSQIMPVSIVVCTIKFIFLLSILDKISLVTLQALLVTFNSFLWHCLHKDCHVRIVYHITHTKITNIDYSPWLERKITVWSLFISLQMRLRNCSWSYYLLFLGFSFLSIYIPFSRALTGSF